MATKRKPPRKKRTFSHNKAVVPQYRSFSDIVKGANNSYLTEDFISTPDLMERKKDRKDKSNKNRKRQNRESKQRAQYGVSIYDLWNFSGGYVWQSYAAVGRAYPSVTADRLVEIALFEQNGMENINHYADPVKNETYIREQMAFAQAEGKVVVNEWADMYSDLLRTLPQARVSDGDYIHDLAAIRSIPVRPNLVWSQWRGVFTDPATVTLKTIKESVSDVDYKKIVVKHHRQRVLYQLSDFDIAYNPLQSIHLALVNTAIYIASTQVHGWDVSMDDTWEEYSARLLKFAEGVYIAGFSGDRELTVEEIASKNDAIKMMPVIIPGLWD